MKLDVKLINKFKEETFKNLISINKPRGNEKGRVTVSEFDVDIVLMGADYFMAGLFHYFLENFKKAAGGLLYLIGIDAGKVLVKKLKLGNDYEKKIGKVLGFLKFTGYSDIEISENNRIIIKNSPDAHQFKKLYPQEKMMVDYYIAGVLAGSISEIIGKDIDIREIKCIANGDEVCEFEIIGL